MVRTQVLLTEEQARRARQTARKMGISIAEYLRRALDEALSRGAPADRESARRRSLRAIGCISSRRGDLSEKHDRYAEEDYAR